MPQNKLEEVNQCAAISESCAEADVIAARRDSRQEIVAVKRDVVDEIMLARQVVDRKLQQIVLLEAVEDRAIQRELPGNARGSVVTIRTDHRQRHGAARPDQRPQAIVGGVGIGCSQVEIAGLGRVERASDLNVGLRAEAGFMLVVREYVEQML